MIHCRKRIAPGWHNLAEIGIITGAIEQDLCKALDQAKKRFDITNYFYGHVQCDMTLAHLNLREKNTSSAYLLFHKSFHSSLGPEIGSFCLEKLADITQWTDTLHSKPIWPVMYLGHAYKFHEKLGIYTKDVNEIDARLATIEQTRLTFSYLSY
jgi:hypothetical protein